MREINVPKENEGYIYTILELDENCVMKCPQTCRYAEDGYACSHIDDLRGNSGYKVENHTINCVKVVFNVKNVGTKEDWCVGPEDAILVDNEGFCYKGILICEHFHDARSAGRFDKFIPNTQVNYTQIFPLLPDCATISSIRVDIHHKIFDFCMSDERNDIDIMKDEYVPSYDTVEKQAYEKIDYDLERMKDRLNSVKTNVYSYKNNILTNYERTKLENKIRNSIYSVIVEVNAKKPKPYQDIVDELRLIEKELDAYIKDRSGVDAQKSSIEKKIDELLNLTPREFQEYICQLYKSLGFEMDDDDKLVAHGVNIIMVKDSVKYAVQCRRYKGTVGSSEVLGFIGAIGHVDADKGIIVTTGMFSFDAEKLAGNHPIELVNRIDLSKLILSALSNK